MDRYGPVGSYGEKVSTVHQLTRSRLDGREIEGDKKVIMWILGYIYMKHWDFIWGFVRILIPENFL